MKRLIALAAAVCLCFAASACGSKGGASGKEPEASAVVEAVSSKLAFKDNMTMLEEAQFTNFYRIDMEKVADQAMYAASRASAEEVTVIRMKDAKDVQLAKDAIEEHLEDQRIAFENYIPEEMAKIEAAQVYTQGAYVMLVVADSTEGAEDAFKAQF